MTLVERFLREAKIVPFSSKRDPEMKSYLGLLDRAYELSEQKLKKYEGQDIEDAEFLDNLMESVAIQVSKEFPDDPDAYDVAADAFFETMEDLEIENEEWTQRWADSLSEQLNAASVDEPTYACHGQWGKGKTFYILDHVFPSWRAAHDSPLLQKALWAAGVKEKVDPVLKEGETIKTIGHDAKSWGTKVFILSEDGELTPYKGR
jgi:hypothetical protein